MRKNVIKLVVAGCLGLGFLALAQELPGYMRKWSEDQLATRAAPSDPTLSDGGVPSLADCTDTEGMLLDSVYAYRVSVCAPGTAVLDGGSAKIWVLDRDRCRWMRDPLLDESIIATSSGGRKCIQFPDREVGVSTGRVLAACDTVGFWNPDGGGQLNDGGSNCSVQIKGALRRSTVP